MLNSLSLAPLKYDERIFDRFFSSASIRKHTLCNGENVYSANIYLKDQLVPKWKNTFHLYSNCDGSGTAKYRNEALYKSISEGFERLAFYSNYQESAFGFDVDCSTNGIAAFPGFTQESARKIAFAEAVERWCLMAFWSGKLKLSKIEREGAINCHYFLTPFLDFVFLICSSDQSAGDSDLGSLRGYGFSAGKKIKSLKFRALVELDRNLEVLNNHESKLERPDLNLLERRLIFFSKAAGRQLFEEILSQNLKNTFLLATKPAVMIDAPIVGEWTEFCKVHRVLFEGMQSESDSLANFSF